MNCPTCGADLNGRSICARCGTLAGAEFALSRIQSHARSFVDAKLFVLSRLMAQHFLWACALMPIFVLPPLVSLTYAVILMRRSREASTSNLEWLAIVSAVNLVVTGLILYKFHFSPWDLMSQAGEIITAI